MLDKNKLGSNEIASYILTAIGLWVVLKYGLLLALLSGLLVYSLVHLLTPLLARRISGERARIVAVSLLAALIITVLTTAIWGAETFFRSDAGSTQVMLKKMADILDASRAQLPLWASEHFPVDADALREMITSWLREHAVEAKSFGEEAGRTAAHLLIGMIIGAMVAMHDTATRPIRLPLAAALHDRMANLGDAFRKIVFAQIRISAINTAFAAIYLWIVLPLAGIHLPLTKSLVVITFLAGLLPIIGNLISNTILVIVALAHSLDTALASLLFMVVVHKLEYFLNARIIGSHIQARAWELLVAMLIMESVFGLTGVVAAPVFYAYAKKELMDRGLV